MDWSVQEITEYFIEKTITGNAQIKANEFLSGFIGLIQAPDLFRISGSR